MKLTRTFWIGLCVFAVAPIVLIEVLGKPGKSLLFDEPLVAGILMAVGASTWVMGYFFAAVARNAMKGARKVPLFPGERVEHRVPANRMRGFVGDGGHLSFTNLRIFFEPHGFNLDIEPVVIAWPDVRNMQLGVTKELALLKVGASLATAHVQGNSVSVHTFGGNTEVLSIVHGDAESRFVVFREPRLVALMDSASERSPVISAAAT